MKTTPKTLMMSLALMGCLILGASDASAQGRSRSTGVGSTTNRSQTTAPSRSSSSSAPTVTRSSERSSSVSRSSSTPQVNRSNDRSSSVSRSTTTPQVSRSSSDRSGSSVDRSTSTPQVTRSTTTRDNRSNVTTRDNGTRNGSGATTRGSSSSSGNVNRGSGNNGGSYSSGTATRRSDAGNSISTGNKATITDRNAGTSPTSLDRNGKPGSRPDGNGKPGGNGNMGNDRDGKNRPNGNSGKPGGNDRPAGGSKPGGQGYGSNNHYDYKGHPHGNDFHRNYTSHSWSWSRPLPPPARPYRPAPLVWRRPVIPAGWHFYASAPVIDRILGLTFGTLFDASLDYLYYNGYEIDGYADHIIYLRDVMLVNCLWDDVMLSYDEYDRLVNAQFVYLSSTGDRYRYNRVYDSLCRIYGTPITRGADGISWYGGKGNGWVTLSTHTNLGHYYTTLSIGY